MNRAARHGVALINTQLGERIRNGYFGHFNRTFSIEVLDHCVCSSLSEFSE